MKKLVMIAAIGSLFSSPAANASSVFDSVYIGAGIGANFVNHDDIMEDCNGSFLDSGHTRPIGQTASGDFRYARKLKDISISRFIGSFVVGAGKTFPYGFYAGLEAGLDISKEEKHPFKIEQAFLANNNSVTVSGTITDSKNMYNVGMRLGFVDGNLLVYLKPSMYFSKTSIDDYWWNLSFWNTVPSGQSGYAESKSTFAIAAGLERALCAHNLSLRAEAEYAFPRKIKALSKTQGNFVDADQYICGPRTNKINLRLLGAYHIRYSTDKSDNTLPVAKSYSFDGFYCGAGLGMNFTRYRSYMEGLEGARILSVVKSGACWKYDDQEFERPTFSFALGYGKALYKNIYAGLEGIVDVTSNKTKAVLMEGQKIYYEDYVGYFRYYCLTNNSDIGYVKYKGLSTQLGLRLGYIFNNARTMVYLRPGVSFGDKIELWNDTNNAGRPDKKLDGGSQTAAFALSIGAETRINDRYAVRCEAEKLFRRSWTCSSLSANNGVDTHWRTHANVDSYKVRIMCTYNFHF